MARPVTTKHKAQRGKNAETIPKLPRNRATQTIADAKRVDPNTPLTEKQKLFVKFWAQGETVHGAAIKAGYVDGGRSAYIMRHAPHIQRAYEAEKAAYEAANQMTRKRVIDGLLEGIDMARLVSEPGNMIAGWREIGKMCGYYAPVEQKITVDHQNNVVMDRLNRLSDAELLKLIKDDPSTVIDVTPTDVEKPRQIAAG